MPVFNEHGSAIARTITHDVGTSRSQELEHVRMIAMDTEESLKAAGRDEVSVGGFDTWPLHPSPASEAAVLTNTR